MSATRNDQSTLAALTATQLGAAWASLVALGFLMRTAIPQFAGIGVSLASPLPWHLWAFVSIYNVLNNQGWILVLLGFAWFVWRLRRRARLEELVRFAVVLNALAFVLVVAACISSLVYVQGTLLPLTP